MRWIDEKNGDTRDRAGAIALVIAWATVFVHARRVANANPIHALRYE